MVAGRGEVEELSRLSMLERGKGRVVHRFIERFVDQNEFEVRLDLPATWVLMDMACFVAEMRDYVAETMKSLADSDGPGLEWVTAVEVFAWISRGSVSYVVKLREVPAAMLERQRMLKEIYQRLDLALSLHDDWTAEGCPVWMRDRLLDAEACDADAKQGAFNMAVLGIYTHVESLGERYAALAGVLNSQVASVTPDGWSKTIKVPSEELVQG